MTHSEINLKILKLLFSLKIKPSDFINIYKKNGDIKLTADYFFDNKKDALKLFNEKDKNCNKDADENLNSIIKYFNSSAVFLLNISQRQYPELLKEIYFPPPLLFCKGEKIIKARNLKIAVVGTRNCSDYGREAAGYLSRQLSKIGFTVVSGMALGVDKYAHEEAIKEQGGSIGILGTGIDIKYPDDNKYLFGKILENGSLVTEFLPGTPPLKNNFPARNRIISGISIGTIVIEAGEKSGAIVTAKSAIRENREVFAVPGNIFSDKSRGCHSLIKSGAKLVQDIDDILEELDNYIKNPDYQNLLDLSMLDDMKNFKINYFNNYQKSNGNLINFPDEDYLKVYNCLGYRQKSIEEIISISGIGIKKVLQILSFLLLKNIAKENNFNYFIKVRKI